MNITIKLIKDKMLKDGNELLENEYINNRTKMKYKCLKHNEIGYAIWTHIKTGKYSCPMCKKEKISKSKTISYEEAKSRVEEKGYKLLSKTIHGTHLKVSMVCMKHGEFKQTLDLLSRGSGCQKCGKDNRIKNQKHDYDFIKNEFETRGYLLLENDYKNCETPMKFICKLHPNTDNQISYNNLKHGKGCIGCYYDGISGENSYLWKGGITPENKLIRSKSEYRNWRQEVFKRDNYTCQCCNKRGGELNAHHIENFSEHEEKRFDVNNGITLCKSCHHVTVKGSFHDLYGTKNNSLEQLNEYIAFRRSTLAQLCADIL